MRNDNRDREGKYSYGDMERICKCGHKLGRHTAEYPHDCCYGDGDDYNQKCDCNGFKLKIISPKDGAKLRKVL